MNEVSNLKDCFPIFNDKCKVIFKSLNTFDFSKPIEKETNLELFQNIYNNLDKMPNLKIFKFIINIRDIKEDLYKNFIKKLFTLKLDEIFIIIKKYSFDLEEFYSKDQLQKIYPEININNINKIRINKLY